jgi:hypothetical protein
MSNALAIASVTAVLKDLLDNAMIDHSLTSAVGGPVSVTALPPDRIKLGEDEKPQLNLFMYQVSPNSGWRNVGLPSADARGESLTNPPLALDLHYLLTAYGKRDLEAEILLGYGMQVLHESPVLRREAIRQALAPPSPLPGTPLPDGPLVASDLADQVELIKVTPQPIGTEEMSRLWSALQAHYRPTAAYAASVVLLESRRSTRAALPVAGRNVYVVPFRRPIIDAVQSTAGADEVIVIGTTLAILGRGLRGDTTRILLGGADVAPSTVSDDRITVPISAPPIPADRLRAGVQGIQVIHRIPMGTPATEHRGTESNVVAFVVHPVVTKDAANNYEVQITNVQPDTGGTTKARVTVRLTPVVGIHQRVVLALNERDPGPAMTRAYTFDAEPRTIDTDQMEFQIGRVMPATYLLRVQVDGAESALDVDAATHRYILPTVTVP